MARVRGALVCAAVALTLAGPAAASQQLLLQRAVQVLTGQSFTVSCVSTAEYGQAQWAGLTELDSPPRIFRAQHVRRAPASGDHRPL
jgi:hypothetical protein